MLNSINEVHFDCLEDCLAFHLFTNLGKLFSKGKFNNEINYMY